MSEYKAGDKLKIDITGDFILTVIGFNDGKVVLDTGFPCKPNSKNTVVVNLEDSYLEKATTEEIKAGRRLCLI